MCRRDGMGWDGMVWLTWTAAVPQEDDYCGLVWELQLLMRRRRVADLGDGRGLFWRWGLEGLELFCEHLRQGWRCHLRLLGVAKDYGVMLDV